MLKPAKVVHVLPQLKIGGVENAALYLLENLPKPIEYHLVCLEQSDPLVVEGLVKTLAGQRLHLLQGKRFNPWTYIKAFCFIQKLKPDWVLFSLWRSQPLLWLFKFCSKQKLVFIFHNNKFKHWPDHLSAKLSLKLCDKICADSAASKRFLQAYSRTPISLLTHYMVYPPVAIAKQAKSLVFIGRIAPNKGLIHAIRLISLLKAIDPSWRLHIYGPDEGAKQDLVAHCEALKLTNMVSFHSALARSEVSATLAQYSYFILPSQNEGMAMVVLEAMQQGLIPLVRPVGQIPFYTKNRQSALWLPDEIDINFAQQLQKLDNNDLKKQTMLNHIQQELSAMPSIIQDFSELFAGSPSGPSIATSENLN